MATGAAQILIVLGASIFGVLGGSHLAYTFFSDRFLPRERAVIDAMKGTSPVLTRETTMWKAWVGFNASHSYGLILFGAVYGYLALAHSDFLFQSVFLLSLGLILLFGYVFLAKRYFFRIPLRGVLLATFLYGLALVASRA